MCLILSLVLTSRLTYTWKKTHLFFILSLTKTKPTHFVTSFSGLLCKPVVVFFGFFSFVQHCLTSVPEITPTLMMRQHLCNIVSWWLFFQLDAARESPFRYPPSSFPAIPLLCPHPSFLLDFHSSSPASLVPSLWFERDASCQRWLTAVLCGEKRGGGAGEMGKVWRKGTLFVLFSPDYSPSWLTLFYFHYSSV